VAEYAVVCSDGGPSGSCDAAAAGKKGGPWHAGTLAVSASGVAAISYDNTNSVNGSFNTPEYTEVTWADGSRWRRVGKCSCKCKPKSDDSCQDMRCSGPAMSADHARTVVKGKPWVVYVHGGDPRARSHCRVVLSLVHFLLDTLALANSDACPRPTTACLAPLFLKGECDRTPGDFRYYNAIDGGYGFLSTQVAKAAGMGVLAVDYHSDAKYPQGIRDVVEALQWLRDQVRLERFRARKLRGLCFCWVIYIQRGRDAKLRRELI
jgi:hypothetical protein